MRSVQAFLLTLGAILLGCRDAASTAPLAPGGAIADEQDLAGGASAAVLQNASNASVRKVEEERLRADTKMPLERPSAGLPSIYGKVIDVRTGLGKPGSVVWFNLGKHSSRTITTGSDGSFRLEPIRPLKMAAAIVRTGPDWRVLSRKTWLSDAQIRGEEEVRIEVAKTRESRVSGIALDAATGEPIPELRFSLGPGGRERWSKEVLVQVVETDKDGTFTTEGNIRGGLLAISTLDGGPRPQLAQVQCVLGTPESNPLELRFLAAPTIDLRLIGRVPSDPTTLSASMQVKRGNGALDEALSSPGPTYPYYRTILRRRDDGSLWIRPPLPQVHPQPDIPLELVLRSPDGMLEGRAPVEYRRSNGPLEVTMVETGTIAFSVRLEPPDAPPSPFGFQHPLLELVAADASGAVFAKEHGRPAGVWKQLPPGPYLVRAWSRSHQLVETSVRVEAGKEQRVELDLALIEETRTVRGSLAIERQGSPRSFDLVINLDGPKPRVWRVHHVVGSLICGTGMDHWLDAADDERSGTFEIEGVPYGRLSARVDDPNRLFDIEIGGQHDGDQFIRLREYSLAAGLGFRVSQGEKSDYTRYEVRTHPLDGGPPLEFRTANGEPVLEGIPGERRFEWILWGSSAGPVLGTHEDFIEAAPGVFFADVNLPPYGSWTPFLIIEDEAGQAVADAVVLVNGKPAQLGPRGELPLSEADKTGTFHSLEVRAPGFQPFQRMKWPPLSKEPRLTVTLKRP